MKGNEDKIRNQKIGFIFQNYYLERGYTIAEIMRNAMLIAGFTDEKEIEKRTEEYPYNPAVHVRRCLTYRIKVQGRAE